MMRAVFQHPWFRRFVADYGMVFVLAGLCAYYSWATLDEQFPTGAAAAAQVESQTRALFPEGANVVVAARSSGEDAAFAQALRDGWKNGPWEPIGFATGQPSEARRVLERLAREGVRLDAVVASQAASSWGVFDRLETLSADWGEARVIAPASHSWPNFLKADNLFNVANQIVVIAVLAVGMTLVIITGGIDLSVGSLIALSAVLSAWLIQNVAGSVDAGVFGMTMACAGGIAACGFLGFFSGLMVTVFSVPAFIATLGMMLVASGLAFLVAEGQSIYQVPDSFVWLGRGNTLGLPNAVLLMGLLYLAAHVLMSRTVLGRYIYAAGGNPEAARLSGVPLRRVLLFVYTLSGALAGLGGVVMASQLKSGSPTYGVMYELYVIAAVVVGGASLAGGEGKVLGTLVGALIIAVIQNGMNLTGVESYTQKVVLGLVILGAVLIDRLKRRGGRRRRRTLRVSQEA